MSRSHVRVTDAPFPDGQAQRTGLVPKAGRIVVLDQGQVVEQGSHEDLLGRGGLHGRLAELQFTRGEAA